MFDLLVFSQYPWAYGPTRLVEESRKNNLKTRIINYKKAPKILPESKCIVLREPDARDFIYDIRDIILNFYVDKQAKVLNSRSYLTWSILDKKTQHKIFEKYDIPHIKLINLRDAVYPFVVKDKMGSHGSHVFKIENKEDLDEVFEKGYKKDDLLVQKFQKAGSDLRVIVLGGKPLGIMQRIARKGNFLTNYSQGGRIKKYQGSDGRIIEKIAVKTAKAFKLDFVGVDLMKGNDGKWKVLEVNRACQFEGFEKSTGINVAKNIIDFLRQ